MNTIDFSNYQKLSFSSVQDLIDESGLINQLQRLLEILELIPLESCHNFEEFSSFFLPEMKKNNYSTLASEGFLEIVQEVINKELNLKIHQ